MRCLVEVITKLVRRVFRRIASHLVRVLAGIVPVVIDVIHLFLLQHVLVIDRLHQLAPVVSDLALLLIQLHLQLLNHALLISCHYFLLGPPHLLVERTLPPRLVLQFAQEPLVGNGGVLLVDLLPLVQLVHLLQLHLQLTHLPLQVHHQVVVARLLLQVHHVLLQLFVLALQLVQRLVQLYYLLLQIIILRQQLLL